MAAAPAGASPPYRPGVVIVGYGARPARTPGTLTAHITREMGVRASAATGPNERLLLLPKDETVGRAVARLRHQPGVAYAVPDYLARAAGQWFPDDTGRSHTPRAWEALQWNFLTAAGVNAPEAWSNLLADHRSGGRGVTVAILDTGVAYRDWHGFRRSPDFGGTRFVRPYDMVDRNRFPLDRNGHGTFVAGLVAESTNNDYALTGLAYGASIMPVRVLDADGTGDAETIAKGIRYAASHGAQVMNLSLEFPLGLTATDLPDVVSALRYAQRRGMVVVAASGNEGVEQVAYPARGPAVISVGATTLDRCLAWYSNDGPGLDLVAPGGDTDSADLDDPNCNPSRSLPDIFQMTFNDPSHPDRFSIPGGWYGTSMASPQVAATAALVIASGVIGRHPSPGAVLTRLEATARPLGAGHPNQDYGYGLVDAGAATTPGLK